MEKYAILTESNSLELLIMLTHTRTTRQPELRGSTAASGHFTLLWCKKYPVKTVKVWYQSHIRVWLSSCAHKRWGWVFLLPTHSPNYGGGNFSGYPVEGSYPKCHTSPDPNFHVDLGEVQTLSEGQNSFPQFPPQVQDRDQCYSCILITIYFFSSSSLHSFLSQKFLDPKSFTPSILIYFFASAFVPLPILFFSPFTMKIFLYLFF